MLARCPSQERRAVNILEHRGGARRRRGTRARSRLQHLLSGLLTDGVKLSVPHSAIDQVPLQTLNRTLLFYGGELFLRAVVLGISDEVARKSIRHAFQEKRPRPTAQPGNCI